MLKSPEWQNLTPAERIERFEFRRLPKIKGFNPRRELVQAVSQYYFSRAGGVSAEDLQQRVKYVTGDEIINQVERDNNMTFTPEEKARRAAEILELVGQQHPKVVLMNPSNIAREETLTRRSNPALLREIHPRNMGVVFEKSILAHAMSHINQSEEEVDIHPIFVGGSDPTTYTQMRGFIFQGHRANGEVVFLNGAAEAMTDFDACFLSDGIQPYISGSGYIGGIRLIEMLNKAAGLDPLLFHEFYTGKHPAKELLKKWGRIKNGIVPDITAATTALLTVALRVSHKDIVTNEYAVGQIRTILNF